MLKALKKLSLVLGLVMFNQIIISSEPLYPAAEADTEEDKVFDSGYDAGSSDSDLSENESEFKKLQIPRSQVDRLGARVVVDSCRSSEGVLAAFLAEPAESGIEDDKEKAIKELHIRELRRRFRLLNGLDDRESSPVALKVPHNTPTANFDSDKK